MVWYDLAMAISMEQVAIVGALREQSGTASDIARRAGVAGRTVRLHLLKFKGVGAVDVIPTHPPTYRWLGGSKIDTEIDVAAAAYTKPHLA
jgi:DNA-binding transcriptional ArsR family regulator